MSAQDNFIIKYISTWTMLLNIYVHDYFNQTKSKDQGISCWNYWNIYLGEFSVEEWSTTRNLQWCSPIEFLLIMRHDRKNSSWLCSDYHVKWSWTKCKMILCQKKTFDSHLNSIKTSKCIKIWKTDSCLFSKKYSNSISK